MYRIEFYYNKFEIMKQYGHVQTNRVVDTKSVTIRIDKFCCCTNKLFPLN